jgi:membrane protein
VFRNAGWAGGACVRGCSCYSGQSTAKLPARYPVHVSHNTELSPYTVYQMRFWRALPALLKDSFIDAFNDGCIGIAKGAAYSALLAFFPVLTSATALVVQTRAEFVSRVVADFLFEVVPPGTEDLIRRQLEAQGHRPVLLLTFAALLSLWAASGVIKSLLEGFRVVYKLPVTRGFWHETAFAMALVLAGLLPVLVASVLVLFGEQLQVVVIRAITGNPQWAPLEWWWRLIAAAARFLLAVSVIMLATAAFYYMGPVRKQRWCFVWPGAFIATGSWLIATVAFAWYVRNVAHYSVVYGSIGASIALLVWMYLLAVIALVGCEFNAHWERRCGSFL